MTPAEAVEAAAKHECEAWQILVSADGSSRYCGACGKTRLFLADFPMQAPSSGRTNG